MRKEPYDQLSAIIAYEQGDMDEDGVIELFQNLVATSLAWRLQGHYSRIARTMVEQGLIDT